MSQVNFGSRAVVATLNRKLDDALGNKDGVGGNETQPANTAPDKGASAGTTNPITYAVRAFFSVGWTKADENARLNKFVDATEAASGPITNLVKPAHVKDDHWATFRCDKAITMLRFDRAPGSVTESYVKAKGSVDGHEIAARDVFTQRWAPVGPPSGKVIVLSPGFLETGRNYAEQADLLSRQGHEVVILDHQWGGLSSGSAGGIDRGFGIARDVAAVTAHAAQLAQQKYGAKAEVIVAGTSMGAGAGALGAVLMNDNGLVKLDGPQMPKGVNVILQGPFFDRTPTAPNELLALAGKVKWLKDLPLAAMGFPILSGNSLVQMKIAMHAQTEHLRGRGQAFHASNDDLDRMKQLLESGARPHGNIRIVHSTGDTLARYAATLEWTKLLGDKASLRTVESTSHVYEENPHERGFILDALSSLAN